MKNKEKKPVKKTTRIILTSLIILLVGFAAYVFISGIVARANHRMPTLFGYSISAVPTPSMEPTINQNDMVLGKKVKYESIKLDDIIIYYSSENDMFIVHRVIGGSSTEGFIVKGDNNAVPDSTRVTKDNFLAKAVWYGKIANIGEALISSKSLILIVLILVISVVLFNGGFEIYKVYKLSKYEKAKEELKKIPTEEELRQQVLKELQEEEKLRNEVINELDQNNKE